MVDIKSIFSKYTDYSLNKDYIITISIKDQKLSLFKNYEEIQNYKISTSKYGEGSEKDSNKTPLGSHYIKEQIGSNADIFTIFKNRMPTREITKVIKDQVTTEEDIISTRILWLSGLEEGKNKGLNVDSYSRFIYIHGTNEEGMLGKKASHGCVRMSNSDIINLCNRDICSALVYISS